MASTQSTSSHGENWQNAVTTARSTPRWPHRIIFPFQVLFTTTDSLFYDMFGLFLKLLLLQLCHLIKLNLHCLQKLEGCCLPLAFPFFFFCNFPFFFCFCLKMNELLAKFKGLKSLHFLGKGKTLKKGHLGIKRGLIRKKEGTRYYVQ